jgi:hypothetical protein
MSDFVSFRLGLSEKENEDIILIMWGHWIFLFSLPNPSSRAMTMVSTQSLTEMSTRNLPGGKGRPGGA